MKKKKLWRITLLVILVTFLIYKTFPSIFMNPERREMYQFVKQVLHDYQAYGLKLDSMNYKQRYNTMFYQFKITDRVLLGIFDKELTSDVLVNIHGDLNRYLKEHPDYLLNRGYIIRVSFVCGGGAPAMSLSNNNWEYKEMTIESGLNYVSVENNFESLSNKGNLTIDNFRNFNGIKGIQLGTRRNKGELTALAKMDFWDYFSIFIPEAEDLDREKDRVLEEVKKDADSFQNYDFKIIENGSPTPSSYTLCFIKKES